MNTVIASFNTTVRQMTEMSQWSKCLSTIQRRRKVEMIDMASG